MAILLTPTFANAQDRRDFCENYAREAVEQSDANERRHCGYSGPRWAGNRAAHFGWCMLSPRSAEDEARARRDQLNACREDRRDDRRSEREGKRASCDTYAKIAEVQALANQKYNCGYRGPEWSTDNRGHFMWCMRGKREFIADEMRFRGIELQKCFNNLGDYDEEGDKDYRRRRF